MERSKELKSKGRSGQLSYWLFLALLAGFLIAAGLTAFLTFALVRDIVASLRSPETRALTLPEFQGQTVEIPREAQLLGETPLQPDNGPPSKPWDGGSRVNILAMGLDYRDWESFDVPRTDTMILFSLDPGSRTIGILSIPRDLWIEIPGFEASKINQAYRLGQVYDIEGGGPGLAMKTVENLLGMQIDYYAVIDFNAFEQFIDELGGITLTVPEEIEVDPLGDGNNQVLQPGEQTLSGDLALAYARARNTTGSDFDRAERQQQVILAVRDRILSAELLPRLIKNSPGLYDALSAGVRTNLTLTQVIRMAWIAQQIPEENIHRGQIGVDQVEFAFSDDGQDILRPLYDAILQLRDEIFFSGQITPAAPPADISALVREEDAHVLVLNGTQTPGLASQTVDYLMSEGIVSASAGNASESYLATTLIDYTGNPHTVEFLSELLLIDPANIYHRYDLEGEADIVVFLGADWAEENPLP